MSLKTIKAYEVQGLYKGRWECLTTCESRSDARARLAEYLLNAPGTFYRIAIVLERTH